MAITTQELVSMSGIAPSTKRVEYLIDTKDAERFFQRMFDSTEQELRNLGKYNGQKIDVRLITAPVGEKKTFLPFMLILPLSVLEGSPKKRGKNNKDDRELDILTSPFADTSNRTGKLRPEFRNLIKGFLYDTRFLDGFTSPTARRTFGNISPLDAGLFKKIALNPRVSCFRGENRESVLIILDPICVFHRMLRWDETKNNAANRPYNTNVLNVQKLNADYEYRFTIERVLINPNKNQNRGGGSPFENLTGMGRGRKQD